jgi:predicted RND superfamily exporter protein
MGETTSNEVKEEDGRAGGGVGSSAVKRKAWPPAWLPILAVICVTAVFPFVLLNAQQAWLRSQNRIEDWLPAQFEETKTLFRFAERFGSDEFLMISWPGCTVGDPKADELAVLLIAGTPDGQKLFSDATSSKQALDLLTQNQSQGFEIPSSNLDGIFIGPDGKQGCVIAKISEAGGKNRKAAMNWAWQASLLATGLDLEEIRIAGITADSIAVDEAASENLVLLNCLSYAVCLAILVLSLKKFLLVSVVFLCAVLNQQIALAFIHLCGGHVDSVQLLVATLCFVLSVSVGLHFLSYLREGLHSDPERPTIYAMKVGFIPASIAALTTSLGFVSLASSQLVPIRSFGIYSAILVPLNAMTVLGLFMIHGKWTSERNWYGRRLVLNSADGYPSQDQNRLMQMVLPWTRAIGKHATLFVIVWVVVVLAFGAGVTRLTTSVGTQKLLSPSSKLIRDYTWLEEHLGALVPLEIMITYDNTVKMSNGDCMNRLRSLENLRKQIAGISEIENTFSILNFLPPLPLERGVKATSRRGVIASRTNEAKERFQEMKMLYEDTNEQCWKLSCRVKGSKPVDYELLLKKLQFEVDQFHASDKTNIQKIEIGGGVPFLYRTQLQLLADLLNSFTSAFITIALTMAVLLRSFLGGLLSMIPNVTPAAVVFGGMGWLGWEVELGTVLTASVMMGICVDDTLHFIVHFRGLRKQGLRTDEAVDGALFSSGGAMIQTAMVCGLGLLVFGLSSFVPISRFAWLTFALLSVGLLSDLMLTPALLYSPLGRWFYRDRKTLPSKQILS